jgi:dTDP-4-amino-4,6-dideoxygalactose transaminase
VRLKWLIGFTNRRQTIAKFYLAALSGSELVQPLPAAKTIEQHVYHLFVVKSPARDKVAQKLKTHGVETLIHYPVPSHKQPLLPHWRIAGGNSLPGAEKFATQCLSLPCSPGTTDAELRKVTWALTESGYDWVDSP